MFFYFNASGDCLGKADILPDIPELATYEILDSALPPDTLWHNGTDVEVRLVVDLGIAPEIQINDVVEFVVPANTRIFEDGADTGATPGATYTIDTTIERHGLLQLRGQSLYRAQYSVHPAGMFDRESGRVQLRNDVVVNATPQQIENYIETNVTDLDSAKEALKFIAKVAFLGFRK